ncbi:hypothetical protein Q8A67_012915 [Cirrhinus molitorella]|uniref:Uncharacterized protein n=1 Tax=Cirrhinus molitorella TaxID=172907 RepID=A0AA88PZ86_9TELE|nr:hypothetical protein Q8A67_012915 [Cirrhinus molitorella]
MTPRSEEGCVWTEAELWDVWTDVDCNDGHLLIDRASDRDSEQDVDWEELTIQMTLKVALENQPSIKNAAQKQIEGHNLDFNRMRDVFGQKQSSGTCGQTLTVMMDICS